MGDEGVEETNAVRVLVLKDKIEGKEQQRGKNDLLKERSKVWKERSNKIKCTCR